VRSIVRGRKAARPLTVRPALRLPLNTAECPPAGGYIARRAGPTWLLEQATSRRNTNQLQKAFIEQAAQCDAFNVKGRRMPMTSPYTPGDMLRQSAIIQSSAYIGIAAILAVFVVAFATAPKARAQDNGHHLHHADHYSKWKQPGTNASCCNGKETNWETSIQRALL
jgi:hypothetical protein